MLHIYAGDGKGKTTAAVGLAVRAAGQGLRVLFVQFLKGMPTGELESLRRLGLPCMWADAGEKFLFQMQEAERAAYLAKQRQCFRKAVDAAADYDMVVLDEGLDAMAAGAFTDEELLEEIEAKGDLEWILTGRSPAKRLADRADYYSHIQSVKHPYKKGAAARRGIEY